MEERTCCQAAVLAKVLPAMPMTMMMTTRDESGRDRSVTIFVFIILFGNGNGTEKLSRKNEIGYVGYKKQSNSIGNTLITVGNR